MKSKSNPKWDKNYPGAPLFDGPLVSRNKIYILVDTGNNTVKYVGKTGNYNFRWKEHLKADTGNDALIKWKKQMRNKNHIKMVVVDSADDDHWQDAERAWITYYRSLGSLFNIHNGGALDFQEIRLKQIERERKRKERLKAAAPKKEVKISYKEVKGVVARKLFLAEQRAVDAALKNSREISKQARSPVAGFSVGNKITVYRGSP